MIVSRWHVVCGVENWPLTWGGMHAPVWLSLTFPADLLRHSGTRQLKSQRGARDVDQINISAVEECRKLCARRFPPHRAIYVR